jgi:hypothetical protein
VTVWLIKTKDITEVVDAPDQFAAWDTLSERPMNEFGLIVTAEQNEDGNPIGIHTAALMRRWDRQSAAQLFDQLARSKGLGS